MAFDNVCFGILSRIDSSEAATWPYPSDSYKERFGSISNQRLRHMNSIGDLSTIQIPLPPLETQQAIVAEIEAEQALVAANRELIARFEKKIQATLARVWGEEEQEQGQRMSDRRQSTPRTEKPLAGKPAGGPPSAGRSVRRTSLRCSPSSKTSTTPPS